jgi:hypothetical protein
MTIKFNQIRLLLFGWALLLDAPAAPPPPLIQALQYLQQQKSYSWEMINADPGPVAQQLQTRRGKVTMVQQNTSPHIRGKIDRNGDTLIEREWSDGLRLDTIIKADGATVTKTPEGWMTNQDILTALAEERINANAASPRLIWLRRADRPDIRRPDQELVPMLNSSGSFEVNDDTYVTKGRLRQGGSGGNPEDAGPPIDVTLTINLRNGMVRDYEVQVDATRAITRARVPVSISDQRIVILTYLPISRIEIPEDAREKLKLAAKE